MHCSFMRGGFRGVSQTASELHHGASENVIWFSRATITYSSSKRECCYSAGSLAYEVNIHKQKWAAVLNQHSCFPWCLSDRERDTEQDELSDLWRQPVNQSDGWVYQTGLWWCSEIGGSEACWIERLLSSASGRATLAPVSITAYHSRIKKHK